MNNLPEIKVLKSTLQGFALCDAVLMSDWELRYYSFNVRWDLPAKEEMGSIRNGEGGEAFFLFSSEGSVGKVLFSMARANALETLQIIPEAFNSFKAERAFDLQNASFFIWRRNTDVSWKIAPEENWNPCGLEQIIGGINEYHKWAETYYSRKIDIKYLSELFNKKEIDAPLLQRLECDRSLDELQEDISEILGFPDVS